jgi:hypothetical protein
MPKVLFTRLRTRKQIADAGINLNFFIKKDRKREVFSPAILSRYNLFKKQINKKKEEL